MPRKNADLTAAEKRALDDHITRTPADDAERDDTSDGARVIDDPRFATSDAERAAVERAFAPDDNGDDVFDNGAAAGAPASDAPSVAPNATSAVESAANAPSGTNTPPAPAAPASGPHNAPSGTPSNAGAAPFLDLGKADEMAALIPARVRVLVSCRAAEPKLSSAGNPMLSYRMMIERIISVPPDVDTPEDVRIGWLKRTIYGQFMFTPPNPVTGSPGTIGRTRDAFKAFGVEWPARTFATQGEFMQWLASVAPLFVGAVATASIGVENPDPTNPKSYDPSTGGLRDPKNSVYAFGPYNAAPRNTPAPTPPVSHNVPRPIESDEDLPF